MPKRIGDLITRLRRTLTARFDTLQESQPGRLCCCQAGILPKQLPQSLDITTPDSGDNINRSRIAG
jgi:hypothetical protein